MYKLISIIILIFMFLGPMTAQTYVDKKGNTHLLGTVASNDLKADDYKEWYDKNYDEHSPKLTRKDGKHLKDINVKIFLGTWCGDTKYLVPRFVKSWEAMGLSTKNLEFIALHNEDEMYKQGPKGETRGMNIHRVPTFVFQKNKKEIGRIVERSVFDLETDIMTIAKGQSYEERYQGVAIINKLFSETNLDSLQTKDVLNGTYKKVRREVAGPGELNTYGYVLMAQDKLREALFVFKLNRFIYRFDPNARDSFAEALYKSGELDEAKEHYLESVRINPENVNAMEKLLAIKEDMDKKKEGS